MQKLSALKGFKDLLPEEARRVRWIETLAHEVFHAFGFSLIQMPILEISSLFHRGIGEATDIVEKEMYRFKDWDGKEIALRPEGTASAIRAYLEHHLAIQSAVSKLYYLGPMFRHERPQAGRLRQFHQIGAEVIGDLSPRQDVELLSLLYHFFEKIQIEGITLEINSLGCPCCRPAHRTALTTYLTQKLDQLCEDCQRRYQSNPLRILDCKQPTCKEIAQEAPKPIDYLCPECGGHFKAVRDGLNRIGIPYTLHPHLVRGLDYYTKTAFEVTCRGIGAQNAVAAGGRYDGLVENLGGPPTPAVGFAIGIERIAQLINSSQSPAPPLSLYIAPLGKIAAGHLASPLFTLRKMGLRCEMGNEEDNLKRQMRQADRLGALHVLIVGEAEMAQGHAILRDMATKTQEAVALSDLIQRLSKRICPAGPNR